MADLLIFAKGALEECENESKLTSIYRWIESHSQDGFIDSKSHAANLDIIFDSLYDRLEETKRENKRLCDAAQAVALLVADEVCTALFADSTAIIREECEKRMEVCRVNVVEAMFAVRHMDPSRAAEMLEQCIRYASLAKLDAEELNRRLHSANVGGQGHLPAAHGVDNKEERPGG